MFFNSQWFYDNSEIWTKKRWTVTAVTAPFVTPRWISFKVRSSPINVWDIVLLVVHLKRYPLHPTCLEGPERDKFVLRLKITPLDRKGQLIYYTYWKSIHLLPLRTYNLSCRFFLTFSLQRDFEIQNFCVVQSHEIEKSLFNISNVRRVKFPNEDGMKTMYQKSVRKGVAWKSDHKIIQRKTSTMSSNGEFFAVQGVTNGRSCESHEGCRIRRKPDDFVWFKLCIVCINRKTKEAIKVVYICNTTELCTNGFL